MVGQGWGITILVPHPPKTLCPNASLFSFLFSRLTSAILSAPPVFQVPHLKKPGLLKDLRLFLVADRWFSSLQALRDLPH